MSHNCLSPLDYWDENTTVVFPNHRSRDMWVMKYLIKKNNQVLEHHQALTMSELLEDYCLFYKNNDDMYLDEQQLFIYHSLQLKKYKPEFQVRLKAHEVLKALNLYDQWLLTQDDLKYFSVFAQEKEFACYLKHCQEKAITHFSKSSFLRELCEKQKPFHLKLSKIVFWALDDLTPLQEKFIDRLKKHTCVIQSSEIPQIKPLKIDKICYQDSKQEISSALQWLEEQSIDHSCAVVIPQLASQFHRVWQDSQEILEPHLAHLPLKGASESYIISHGFRADTVPLIEQTLSFFKEEDFESPYFHDEKIYLVNHTEKNTLSYFIEKALLTLDKNLWCQTFQLSSTEYQAREFFLDTLESVGANCFDEMMSWNSFCQILQEVFEQLLFQPQSPSQPKKFILGLLEAAALPLDKIFLVQTSEQELLAAREPHRYFNISLAQQKQMPQSSWEREIGYLTKMISRLSHQKEIIISYATLNRHWHRLQSPCLLIEELYSLKDYRFKLLDERKPKSLELLYIDDTYSFNKSLFTVSQLNAYFHCPFKGYSQFLHLPTMKEEICLPLTPKEQGIYFHEYLQAKLTNTCTEIVDKKYLSKLPKLLIQAEQRKAYRVWISLDKNISKEQFSVEWPWKVEFEGIGITGRCDLYQAHDKIIYDFKSKNFNFSQWFSLNPADLQGALYVVALGAQKLGVIKADRLGAKWRTESVEPYEQTWKALLKNLVGLMKKGYTSPNPRVSSHCRNCSLKQSCRYHLHKS